MRIRLRWKSVACWTPISGDAAEHPDGEARNVTAVATPRIALTPDEAAAAIGVGRSFFYENVLPDLRVVRIGRKRLIPVRELEHWTDRNAARTLE